MVAIHNNDDSDNDDIIDLRQEAVACNILYFFYPIATTTYLSGSSQIFLTSLYTETCKVQQAYTYLKS